MLSNLLKLVKGQGYHYEYDDYTRELYIYFNDSLIKTFRIQAEVTQFRDASDNNKLKETTTKTRKEVAKETFDKFVEACKPLDKAAKKKFFTWIACMIAAIILFSFSAAMFLLVAAGVVAVVLLIFVLRMMYRIFRFG